MKTIRELADELNTSKQTIRNTIAKLDLQNSLRKDANRFVIDEEQEKLIKLEFNGSIENETAKSFANDDTNCFTINFAIFQEELQKKNEQLEAKDIQINELHKLLDQQQKLNLHTQQLLSETQLQLETKTKEIEEDEPIKRWWQFWK